LEAYNKEFYQTRNEDTKYSAEKVLSILLANIPKINSAVDIGCGVGTWLNELKKFGVADIQGYDGKWVDPNMLAIPKNNFTAVNLNEKLPIDKNFDLAISLEVAEHLPQAFAKEFVASITSLSELVLFSAAIPNQGGDHHINEQWPDYWVQLFKENGYEVFDFIRPKIWQDTKIPYWYQQNILFFAKINRVPEVKAEVISNGKTLRMVHPDLLAYQVSKTKVGIKGSLKYLWQAIKNYFTRKK
jgi:SAM-dependent methyltransferase